MPGFDRTGPEGRGPMTGRKLGKCTGHNEKENGNREGVRGLGLANRWGQQRNPRGRGIGRRPGRGKGFGKGRGDANGFRFRGGDLE
ncbi:MAG: DUF5320 domain-containing protein [Bacteroidales bacterium]|nr:DUF5320 domain-containing protein [Bacteroidales bacterium]MCF8337729.1 DUF5320 domain-containing protein [Bacteroidales bacterium]